MALKNTLKWLSKMYGLLSVCLHSTDNKLFDPPLGAGKLNNFTKFNAMKQFGFNVAVG